MERLALPWRVTFAFTLAAALVLVALGAFLHARLRAQLDASIGTGLRQRAGDLAALAAVGDPRGLGAGGLAERGDDPAQVLDADGRIVAAAPGFEDASLLTARERLRATRGALRVRRRAPGDDEDLALLAAPARARVVVVGTSLEDRDDALESLDALLAVGLPVALLAATGAGFLVAGAALRPIERLRARADDIGSGELAERLPVPVAHDEVRRLAETLNRMLARLEQAFARERAFVSDASHELRTPLARLKAELELACRGGRSVEALEAAVRSAAAETDTLASLAEDLLVLARADQGRLPLRRERVQVAELLDDVRRRAGPEASVEAPDGLELDADPVRLRQALGNLVENARRHGAGAVTLAAEPAGDAVVLRVRDAGDGIPVPLRATAFERFTRGDAVRGDDGGAGLGLAIVAAIATAHGGTAGIGDAPGGGADVWIRLPRP
jgi:two-component system, OmpR family, sensor kinase